MPTSIESDCIIGLGVLIEQDPTPITFGPLTFNAVVTSDPEKLAMLAAGYDEQIDKAVTAKLSDFGSVALPVNRDFVTVGGLSYKVVSVLKNGAFIALGLKR